MYIYFKIIIEVTIGTTATATDKTNIIIVYHRGCLMRFLKDMEIWIQPMTKVANAAKKNNGINKTPAMTDRPPFSSKSLVASNIIKL